jgi:hypothetical protein
MNMKWIKVSEQLPEPRYGEAGEPPVVSEDVLAFQKDSPIYIANYDHEQRRWCIDGDIWGLEPSHWMPLPEAP